jgi:hypothetical protein
MYGKHDLPFTIEQEGISISMTKSGDSAYQYLRTCGESTVEKSIVVSKGELMLHPIEPLNTPKILTPYLLIEFEKKLLLEPKGNKRFFLTFPIDIGVLIRGNKEVKVVDSMSLVPQKFTLYGDPKQGLICKYWQSSVHDTMPVCDRFREGVLELTISSSSREWEEISKTVLNAYGMKLYYNDKMVTMKGKMKLGDDKTADIDVQDTGLERSMKKSLETFAPRKLSMITTIFHMEYGL